MIHLYLVRHGDCEGEGLYIGRGSDLPLSEKGVNQIHLMTTFLGEELSGRKIDSLFSSPMTRAIESGKIISSFLNKPIQLLQGIEEIDFGKWEGKSYRELMDEHPEEFSHWIDNSLSMRPPGGESLEDLQKRVLKSISFIKDAALENTEKNIVMVSHRGPLVVVLLNFLGLGLDKFWNYKIERGSISKLNIYPRFTEMDFLNRKF